MKRLHEYSINFKTVCLIAVALMVAIAWSAASADNRTYDSSTVRFTLSASVIEPDVNPDDALAAAKVWSASLGANTGAWTKSDPQIGYNLPGLVQSVKAAETDVIALSTQEYLEIETELKAEPALAYVQSGQTEIEYVVIARKDSDAKTLADLKGKRIVLGKGGRNCLAKLWLDVMLADSGMPTKETYFREIKEAGKASQIVLPVFFGQIDAGIITKTALDTAIILNPQIGRQVISIATSPRLVTAVICMRTDLPSDRKNLFISQALKLHETPGGLQTFNIFKMERLIRWDPRFLDPVRDLYRRQKLSKNMRRATGRPGLAPREEK